MLLKIDNSFNHNSSAKAVKRLPVFLVLFLVIFPLFVAAVYTSLESFHDLHKFTLSRKEAVASLAATILKEKFDRVIDVGTSLSTRVQFQIIVKKLVEEAGGSITVDSKIGEGTTFSIFLPLAGKNGIIR